MIPKKIHYCWFGGNPKPKLAKKCIKSWKKFCPDYEIIEWNESNLDIEAAPLYIRQAYEVKKYGFVPDYFRVKIIYDQGGIYLDTDVEIIKPIDDLLYRKTFFGFETDKFVNLGHGFGGEKGQSIFKEIMNQYNDLTFIKEDGSFNMLPSPQINTEVFAKHGLALKNEIQVLDNYITVFPKDFFSPKNWGEEKLTITKNTYSIHWFSASWLPKNWRKKEKQKKRKEKRRMIVKRLLGEKLYNRIKKILKR